MRLYVCILAFVMGFSMVCFAGDKTLNQRFDFLAYKQCFQHIKRCPISHNIADDRCLKSVVSKNKSCKQLHHLSKLNNVPENNILAEKVGNLTLITYNYIADGQKRYSIIGFKGRITNLLDALQKKHPNQLVLSNGKPSYKKISQDKQIITMPFKVTTGCVACAIIKTGNKIYQFDEKGRLLSN